MSRARELGMLCTVPLFLIPDLRHKNADDSTMIYYEQCPIVTYPKSRTAADHTSSSVQLLALALGDVNPIRYL